MALFYVILNKVNFILAFTTLYEFFKLFCLYYTLTHIEYNIFELSLDEYYFQAHAHDLVQSVLSSPFDQQKGINLERENTRSDAFPFKRLTSKLFGLTDWWKELQKEGRTDVEVEIVF